MFLKIDGDPANADVEVRAMAMAPIPTPTILWREPPVPPCPVPSWRAGNLNSVAEDLDWR